MKLVCWGMCAAPVTFVSQHPLVEQRAAPSASPRLPARRDDAGHADLGVVVDAPRLGAPARAPPPPGPRTQQLLQLGDGPQRRDVDAVGQRDAGVLERARQLGVHQAVEAQLAERGCPAARRCGGAPETVATVSSSQATCPPSPAAASAPLVSSFLRRRRAISAATSRRLIDRFAGLGQIALPDVQAATRFQNGRSAETLRKCSSTFAVDLGARTAPGRARGRRPPRTPPARRRRRARRRPTAP